MKKFVITIVIFKHTVLEIRPFYWFLYPTEDHARKPERYPQLKAETVDAALVMSNGDVGMQSITRRRQVFNCWQWLCFTITFLTWYQTEAADIYPANYDAAKDEFFVQKWDTLCKTEYFC